MALSLEILLGLFGGEDVETDATLAALPDAGTEADVSSRLRSWLPPWFGNDPDQAPAKEATIAGPAWALSFIFDLVGFAKLQTRIATATGGWLELIANDYLGPTFRRLFGEPDPSYSTRIRREILRHRNTRKAVRQAVEDLTGVTPIIYEPWRPADCGGLGSPSLSLGVAGVLGSRGARREAFITVPYPQGYGIPNRTGLGDPLCALGAPSFGLCDDQDIAGSGATIQDICAAVERVRPVAMTLYLQFSGLLGAPVIGAPRPYQ
jgi:hypothetical protein